MGDGTEKNPYTREDVLRLIKKNGDTAEGLDLSGKVFEDDIDLSKLNLHGIILKEAWLPSANLERTDLEGAQLEEAWLLQAHLDKSNLRSAYLKRSTLSHSELRGARLTFTNMQDAFLAGADLQGASLSGASLEGANFREAKLRGICLLSINISQATDFESADWGNYVLWEEKHASGDQLLGAYESYRRLKIWHTEHGLYDIAGKFFYREMEVKRKIQSWKREPHLKLWSWVTRMLCGYGEKPERVGISAAVVIFGLAAAYYFWGTFSSSSFWDTLYYSAASFTALGYGQWAPQPTGWARGMGAAEAVIGVFMMALFLVTFTRKMTR